MLHRYISTALGALVLGALIFPITDASAQAGTVTVAPASDLVDEQFVKVSWSGFPADGLVYVRQCLEAPIAIESCSSTLENGISKPDGSGSLYYQVHEGEHPDGGFICDLKNECVIGAFESADDLTSARFSPLEFAFPPTSCPSPEGAVAGSGSSAVFRAMLRWSGTVCREPFVIPLQFTVKNSIDGLRDLIVKLTDFAVTSVPFTPEQLQQLADEDREVVYAPISVSALGFGYRLFDRSSGEQITNLKLTPQLLAEIFTGQIANWNDPRIVELNPGWRFPTQVRAIGRADNSATTLLLTSWFEAVAKDAYRAGGEAFQGGPTEIYPSTGDANLKTGSAAVALEVAKPAEDRDGSVFGQIGWMDVSYASIYGLPVVQIVNAAGQFVLPTDQSVTAGVEGMLEGGSVIGTPAATESSNDEDPAAQEPSEVEPEPEPTTAARKKHHRSRDRKKGRSRVDYWGPPPSQRTPRRHKHTQRAARPDPPTTASPRRQREKARNKRRELPQLDLGTLPLPDFANKDPKAYPLPVVSYMVIPTDGGKETLKLYRSWLSYVISKGQKDLPIGYVPMTKDLIAQTETAASALFPKRKVKGSGAGDTTGESDPTGDVATGGGGGSTGDDFPLPDDSGGSGGGDPGEDIQPDTGDVVPDDEATAAAESLLEGEFVNATRLEPSGMPMVLPVLGLVAIALVLAGTSTQVAALITRRKGRG